MTRPCLQGGADGQPSRIVSNIEEPKGHTMPENEEATPATEAKPDVAQTSDTKAEATSTVEASDELSDNDLEAVAGGFGGWQSWG